nr:hypothetical protein [Tanacetum cinerariifolium]
MRTSQALVLIAWIRFMIGYRSLLVSLKFLEYLSQDDINLKFLRSLPTEWKTHTLIWRNKTNLEEQSLDDLALRSMRLKLRVLPLRALLHKILLLCLPLTLTVLMSQLVLQLVFLLTNEPVSAAASVSALPNVDTLSNAEGILEQMDLLPWDLICPRRSVTTATGKDTLQGSVGLLKIQEGMCDGVGSYDWSFQADEEPTNYALMAFTSSRSSSDNEVVSYSKACTKAYATLQSHYDKLTDDYRKSQFRIRICREDESETKISQNVPSFIQPTEQVKSLRPSIQHVETSIPTSNPKIAIPKPTSNGNRMNRKACFMCKSLDYLIKDYDYHEKNLAQTTARNHAPKGHQKQYARMTFLNSQRHVVPTAVLTQSKLVPINAVIQVSTADPKIKVTRPRQAKTVVTQPNSPPRRHIKHSPSLKAINFPPNVTAAKASMGNPQHALKDKGVIDSGCSRHMTGNMSYLFDFEELNGGYVSFGGNPKGSKISRKNENQVLLSVPRENNMYNVDLKNIVPSRDLICLFAKATFDESNL